MCSAPQKENEIVFGVAYGDIFQFDEDGTFSIYPNSTFRSDGAQTSGAYKLLTVKRTATNTHGTMQLTLTTQTPLDVRVPYTYIPQESKRDDRLWLATTSDHFPCQLCVLCPVRIPTQHDQ